MNYLQIVNEVLSEAGLTDEPVTAAQTQTGMAAKVARYAQRAWLNIQQSRTNWRFMWYQPALPIALTPDVSIYGNGVFCPLGLSNLDPDNLYVREAGGMFRSLRFATWEDYLLDLGGNAKPTGLPSAVAVAPDTSIHFNRAPGAGVEVSLAHFTAPQVLTAASEIPRLAEKLQPVIVYEALRLYAKHDNAPEVYANAVEEHRYYMKLLDREQKPRTRMAESALTAVYGD